MFTYMYHSGWLLASAVLRFLLAPLSRVVRLWLSELTYTETLLGLASFYAVLNAMHMHYYSVMHVWNLVFQRELHCIPGG